jgi:hypothetical protein
MRSLLLFVLPSLVACSGFLDLGGNGSSDEEKTPEGSPTQTPGNGDPTDVKPKVDCGNIPAGATEVYRAPSSDAFNVMDLVSDGKHLYLAGSVSQSSETPAAPDPANPMKTASILRVPVTGGPREVIEFEHGNVSRGVVVDNENIYWASEYQDAVLMRPKAGGAVTPFALGATAGIPQSVATDGKGNVFWTTWHGGFASASSPVPALGKRASGSTSASTFQESRGEADGAFWVTSDATQVYWLAGRGSLELRAAPTSGGKHVVLATGVEQAYRLTTDGDHVWGVSNDFVWKVPKKGGDRVNVATAKAGRDLRAVAVSDDAIYFSDDMEPTSGGGKVVKGPIYKAKKDGSTLAPLTEDYESATHLTADACRLYWVSLEWVGNPGYELVVRSHAL